jgi:hypothetical protein
MEQTNHIALEIVKKYNEILFQNSDIERASIFSKIIKNYNSDNFIISLYEKGLSNKDILFYLLVVEDNLKGFKSIKLIEIIQKINHFEYLYDTENFELELLKEIKCYQNSKLNSLNLIHFKFEGLSIEVQLP